MKKLLLIPCPDLKYHKKPLKDQPGCEAEECPECSKKMWVSSKKRMVREQAEIEYKFLCYPCMKIYIISIAKSPDNSLRTIETINL